MEPVPVVALIGGFGGDHLAPSCFLGLGCQRLKLGVGKLLDQRGVVGLALTALGKQVARDSSACLGVGVGPDETEQPCPIVTFVSVGLLRTLWVVCATRNTFSCR